MSYILDALNKSEEERQREQLPNLKTVHRSGRANRRRGLDLWQTAILLLVAGNLLLLFLWLRAPAPAAESAPIVAEPPVQHQSAAASPSVEEARVEVPLVTTPPAEELITPPARRALMPQLESAELPTINELPPAIQQQIPDLTFASHIYSSSPQSRLVSINGSLSREGDRVAGGLLLLGITEEGIVLQFQEYQFRMSILRDWSFN